MTFALDIQAVVLAAGRGSRMLELTTKKCRCLLPVGSKPMVWYPLDKLQQSGFTDVILVVLESEKNEIQSALEKTDLNIKIDYVPISDNEDLGTAVSLKLIADKLKSDVLILPCDVITDASLASLLYKFRANDASIVSLLFHPQENGNASSIPGPKSKHKQESDICAIDEATDRLVFRASPSDYEDVPIPIELMKKHPKIRYHNVIDSHIYVFKNWVIKYLESQPDGHIATVKGELLPHIVKQQLGQQQSGYFASFVHEDEIQLMVKANSSAKTHFPEFKSDRDSVKCFAYFPENGSFGMRINTLSSYWSIFNKINTIWTKIKSDAQNTSKHPKAIIESNQVDENCIIWEGAHLHAKTSFKNSLIGTNTEVHSFSRTLNSIVMNNVTINDHVVLENCIVCDGATLESGCTLKNCIIGSQHTVKANSEHTSEVLTEVDRLMEF